MNQASVSHVLDLLADPGAATGAPLGAGGIDGAVMVVINKFARATPWLHGLMYGYATYGVVVFACLLAAGWWTARSSGDPARVAAALWAGAGTLAAVGLNQPIVAAVAEPRPYTGMPGLLVLADRSLDYSFPSDHATMAGAVAAGTLLVTRRLLAWMSVTAAGLIAFARVYIAAHYPQDVAAGLLVGAIVVLVGWFILRGPLTWIVNALADGRLAALVVSGSGAIGRSAHTEKRIDGQLSAERADRGDRWSGRGGVGVGPAELGRGDETP